MSDRKDGGFWTFDEDVHVELTRRAGVPSPTPSTP
jgi:hypothetical protein